MYKHVYFQTSFTKCESRRGDVAANGAVYREFYFFTAKSANFVNSQRQNLLYVNFSDRWKTDLDLLILRALLYFKLFVI